MQNQVDEKNLTDYLELKKENKYFTLYDYTSLKLSLEQVLICSTIFIPRIDRVGRFIFLRDSRQFESLHIMLKKNPSSRNIEGYVNHIFLSLIFETGSDSKNQIATEKTQLKTLGENIKYCWTSYFKENFPDKNIIVDFYKDDFDEYCITFYQDVEDFEYDRNELEEYLKSRQ